MKKIICYLIIIIVIITSFIIFKNGSKDYQIKYKTKGYTVIEKYNKNKHNYYFKLVKDDKVFEYIIDDDYSSNRKLITNIIEVDNCVQIETKNSKSNSVCYDDNGYYINNSVSDELITSFKNVDIYNKYYKYYIWNNYGITNLNNHKDYNFVNHELYNNNIYYQVNNSIIFINYNDQYTFDKFIVFNIDENKYHEIKADKKIDMDIYFLGDIDNEVYFFDKKNKVEYKINLEDNEIIKVSDKKGGMIYQNGFVNKTLNDLTYNNLKFSKTNPINYSINEYLYMNIYDSDIKIRLTDFKVDSILYTDNNNVYFVVDNSIYSYNYNKGINKLLSSFEWNFRYQGKVFIFE